MFVIGNFLGNMGLPELLIVLVLVMLLFGAKKLPELARSLGKSVGEFKKGREDGVQPTEPEKASPEKASSEKTDEKK